MPPEPTLETFDTDLQTALKDMGVDDVDLGLGGDKKDPEPWKKEIEGYKEELKSLRGLIEQQSRQQRFVTSDVDAPAPRKEAEPAPATPAAKREFKVDKWAAMAQENPGRATIEAINAELGLAEGSNPFNLFPLIGQKLKELEDKDKARQAEIAQTREQIEAENFMKTHPDYEANDKNSQTIIDYLKQYGLPPSANNFHLAYTAAVADGNIEAKKSRRQAAIADEGDTPVPRKTPRVPSVRQSNPSGDEDFNLPEDKLDRLSMPQLEQLMAKVRNGR